MEFSDVKRFFNKLTVEVKGNQVIIEGLPTEYLEKEIFRIWRTSRIAEHMFTKATRSKLVFDQFFLPDFYYALHRVIGEKHPYINRRMCEEMIILLEQNTWISNINKNFGPIFNRTMLKNLVWAPEPHQTTWFDTAEQLIQRMGVNGTLLSAEPGTGKTFMSMAMNEMLETDLAIYIVPNNSVDEVWDKTHRDILKGARGTFWTSHSGLPPLPGKRIYIFHYETLEQALNFIRSNLKWVMSKKTRTITLDECHNFNSIGSLRTELFMELCKVLDPRLILWMSGTPIKALGSEVIPFLTTIDPYFTPEVRERFKKIFGMSSTAGMDILANRLGLVSHKIEKDQVLKHKVLNYRVDVRLPNGKDYTLETIRGRMAAYIGERMAYYQENMDKYIKQYKEGLALFEKRARLSGAELTRYETYKAFADSMHVGYDPMVHKEEPQYCNKYEKTVIIPLLHGEEKVRFKNATSVYKYYHLKVQGEALGRILGRARTQCNVDICTNITQAVVTDLQTNERDFISLPDIINRSIKKTLLFTDYVEVVNKVCEYLEKQGFETLRVYGDTNKDLQEIVKDFGKKAKYNPLVATFKSLSTAVPMIMANTVVMLNTPFRPHDFEQSVSRADRMGQDEDVHVYVVYLDTGVEPNISTRSKDIMDWATEMVEAIMGKKTGNLEIATEEMTEEAEQTPALELYAPPERPNWLKW